MIWIISGMLIMSICINIGLIVSYKILYKYTVDLWCELQNEKWLQCLKDSGAEIINLSEDK